MDELQPTIISDADLETEFQLYGAARCRRAADKLMGGGTIRRLRDIPQQKRPEFLAVLRDQSIAANDATLIANGYEPVALVGKAALGKAWPSRSNTVEAINAERASLRMATNTGARTGRLSVADIDLIPADHAAAMKALAFQVLGETQLERVGSKGMALCYRNETPIRKILISGLHTSITHTADGKTVPLPGKVEILGIGQQLAIYGDHPDTGKPYIWTNAVVGAEPLKTKLSDTPETTPTKLREFVRQGKILMEKFGYREVTITGDMNDKSTPETENVNPPRPKKSGKDAVTAAQVRDMLGFIDPRFNGIAPKNFDAGKFRGEFGWGMNEWAGISRMIWNGEIPLAGEDADNFDGPALCFDWSSGKFWQERTRAEIETSCPATMSELEKRLSGEAGAKRYTVATIIKLACACGYDGPIGVSKDRDFDIGSHIELAQRLIADLAQEHGGDVIHTEGDFSRYDGQRWAVIADNDLRRQAHHYDGLRYGNDRRTIRLTQSSVSSILHEAAAMIERPRFFDASAIGINCESGFITFDTGGNPKLGKHDPEHRARHVIPATWRPDLDLNWEAPLLMQLLNGCFRDDHDKSQRIDLIGEICGAAAMGTAPWMLKQPKAFVLFGKHANNGKSQIIDMIRGLLPLEGVASVPPSQFNHDAYRVKLRGKLLNTPSELGTAQTISSEDFKYIVTGDPMTVNVKYKDAVEFRARAVHVFATNVLPPFRGGMDRGVRRRLCVMNFSRVFEAREMVERIGERVAAEEADALLAFAVTGAARLLKQGQYTEPPSCAAALREWLLASDPVIAWMECRTEFAAGHVTFQHDLYSDFDCWARREGFGAGHLPKINNFIQRITQHDHRLSTHRAGKGGKDGYTLHGLKLLPSDNAVEMPTEQLSNHNSGEF